MKSKIQYHNALLDHASLDSITWKIIESITRSINVSLLRYSAHGIFLYEIRILYSSSIHSSTQMHNIKPVKWKETFSPMGLHSRSYIYCRWSIFQNKITQLLSTLMLHSLDLKTVFLFVGSVVIASQSEPTIRY